MYIAFLSLLLLPFIVLTIINTLKRKKSKDTIITEKMQFKMYIQSIAFLWGMTLAIFIMCLIGNISLENLGFRRVSFRYNIWFTVVTLILNGLALFYFVYQLIMSLISKKWREKQLTDIDQGTLGVLPRTKKEKCFYSFMALSAGICEEIIYRGFLVFLLQAVFPNMPIYFIILIPSLLFGISHFYQGLQGVISTGVLGLLFMSLFIATDSLFLAMLLHFFVDFSATFVLSEEQAK